MDGVNIIMECRLCLRSPEEVEKALDKVAESEDKEPE